MGLPTAGRQQPETHALVGYFINPLPIRAVPPEGAAFAELAKSAAAAIEAALAHSLLPLAEVVRASGVGRTLGVSPLFQVGGREGERGGQRREGGVCFVRISCYCASA